MFPPIYPYRYEIEFPLDGSMMLEFRSNESRKCSYPTVTVAPQGHALPLVGHFLVSIDGTLLNRLADAYERAVELICSNNENRAKIGFVAPPTHQVQDPSTRITLVFSFKQQQRQQE